jgi:hypothetical protein
MSDERDLNGLERYADMAEMVEMTPLAGMRIAFGVDNNTGFMTFTWVQEGGEVPTSLVVYALETIKLNGIMTQASIIACNGHEDEDDDDE